VYWQAIVAVLLLKVLRRAKKNLHNSKDLCANLSADMPADEAWQMPALGL
jgi:hypothetical protein